MRKFFYLSGLIFLYLLLTAKSCDNNEQASDARDQTRIKLTQDSIKSTFESDAMSIASLRAFDLTARLKLSDFSDYLSFLSDSTVAPAFQEKTREMIRRLFISENSVVQFSKPDYQGRKEITIKQLLNFRSGLSKTLEKLPFDSIKVMQSLGKINDSVYVGKLIFPLNYSGQTEKKSQDINLSKGTISFLAIKCEKKFGKERLKIWTVFLGTLD